jgi:hypothetical protein
VRARETKKDDVWGQHDVSIIELEENIGKLPKETLKLPRDAPRIGQGPLSLLGHPHGTPLKFTESGSQAYLTTGLANGAPRASS